MKLRWILVITLAVAALVLPSAADAIAQTADDANCHAVAGIVVAPGDVLAAETDPAGAWSQAFAGANLPVPAPRGAFLVETIYVGEPGSGSTQRLVSASVKTWGAFPASLGPFATTTCAPQGGAEVGARRYWVVTDQGDVEMVGEGAEEVLAAMYGEARGVLREPQEEQALIATLQETGPSAGLGVAAAAVLGAGLVGGGIVLYRHRRLAASTDDGFDAAH